MSKGGAQHRKTLTDWHEMQRSDTSPVKTDGSKTSNSFEKVDNIISTS